MAFIQYLKFDYENLPLPDSYNLDLTDVEADSGGETEAGTMQRDVIRSGVVTISVSFSVSAVWLTNAAKEAGLDLLHSGAKRMMRNKHYLGDDFYPAIIDKEFFDAVEIELIKRSTKLGRNDRYNAPKAKRPPTAFRLGDITENCDNPIRQAEYLYSLIESEVI